MLNGYHGRTEPLLSVLSAPPFIGDPRCDRPGTSTRSRRRTFGATRIVTGAAGCRE